MTTAPDPSTRPDMAIDFKCWKCGRALSARAENAGRPTRCPQCDSVMFVPESLSPNLEAVQSLRRRLLWIRQRLPNRVPVTTLCFVGVACVISAMVLGVLALARCPTVGELRVLRQHVRAYSEGWLGGHPEVHPVGPPTASSRRPEVYRIGLRLLSTGERQIKVTASTNLPDGTNLHVRAYRSYYEEGETDSYAGDLFSQVLPVSSGRVEASVAVDDRRWLDARQNKRPLLKELQAWSDISRVSPAVTVRVLYTPRQPQPDEVVEVLGRDGEHVAGPQTEKVSGFTVCSVKKSIGVACSVLPKHRVQR